MRMLREAACAATSSPSPSSSPLTRLDTLSALPLTSAFRLWREANSSPSDSPWLSAFVLVAFHLERGQVVEAAWPPGALTSTELDAVCFHAMPDSAAVGTEREDAMYSFRIVREDSALLLCHALFRQAPDPGNPRGFFQKALVVISAAPCMQLYAAMLATLAEGAFVRGADALEQAVVDVEAWPDPFVQTASRELALPFAGETIHVALPQSFLSSFAAPSATLASAEEAGLDLKADASSPTRVERGLYTDSSLAEEDASNGTGHAGAGTPDVVRQWPLTVPSSHAMAAPFNEVDLAVALRGVHDRLWTLWELVALGEPLLVFASTPPQVAAAVLGLVGLVHPLPFVGDWRPYFCIQDAIYGDIFRASKVADVLPNGAVYGVTNSHLTTTLKFPHVLTLPAVNGIGKARKAGLISAHRGSLHKSRQLTDALRAAVTATGKRDGKSAGWAAATVRACIFEKITRPFLRAFDRYLVPTWNGGLSVTAEPYASDPFGRKLGLVDLDLKTFPAAEDLASPGVMSLFRSGAISKNRVRGLYERFARGPVFRAWWEGARTAAERECGVLHRTDLIEACMRGTGVVGKQLDKDEVEDARMVDRVVDLCLRVQEEVRSATDDDYVLKEKLCALLEDLAKPLPDEVRLTMRMPSMS